MMAQYYVMGDVVAEEIGHSAFSALFAGSILVAVGETYNRHI